MKGILLIIAGRALASVHEKLVTVVYEKFLSDEDAPLGVDSDPMVAIHQRNPHNTVRALASRMVDKARLVTCVGAIDAEFRVQHVDIGALPMLRKMVSTSKGRFVYHLSNVLQDQIVFCYSFAYEDTLSPLCRLDFNSLAHRTRYLTIAANPFFVIAKSTNIA